MVGTIHLPMIGGSSVQMEITSEEHYSFCVTSKRNITEMCCFEYFCRLIVVPIVAASFRYISA